MPFPFTFNFSVPGLSNPFSAPPPPPQIRIDEDPDDLNLTSASEGSSRQLSPFPYQASASSSSSRSAAHLNPPAHNYNPHVPVQRSRKRSRYSAPTPPVTTLAQGSGYLDTPAKYREMAEREREMGKSGSGEDEVMYVDDEDDPLSAHQPPAKRRRGLAGSIVSTALSAALIGTAVGLTVYRLWRDRGKEPQTHEEAPPPPYSAYAQPHLESQPDAKSQSQTSASSLTRIRTPQRPRHTPRRRRPAPRPTHHAVFPNTPQQPEFSFSAPSTSAQLNQHTPFTFSTPHKPEPELERDGDDHLSRLSSQLSSLIEEGKRALGREVVVMSECREDEVDDGLGGWVEDDDADGASALGRSNSRGSSPRRIKKRTSRRSLNANGFGSYSQPSTPSFSQTGFQPQTPASTAASSFQETTFDSPEIRESMEKARRKVLEARAAKVQRSGFS